MLCVAWLLHLMPAFSSINQLVDSFPDDDDIIVGQFSVKMKDLLESQGSEMKKLFQFDGLDGKGVEGRILLRVSSVLFFTSLLALNGSILTDTKMVSS